MGKLMAIAACLLLAVSMLAYFTHRSHAQDALKDKDYLEATALAMRNATSWHYDLAGPAGRRGTWMHKVVDRVCPQGMYMVVDEPDGDLTPPHREYFYTRKDVYYRLLGRWVGLRGTPIDECALGPNLEGAGMSLPLHDLLANSRVASGQTRYVGSELCREYQVQEPWGDFVICVNPADHLPREVVSSHFRDEKGEFVNPLRVTYSKWNQLNESDLPSDFPSDPQSPVSH